MSWIFAALLLLRAPGEDPRPTAPESTEGRDRAAPDRVLVIGTKEAPPFAMRGPDGTWTGISIELWQDVANRLGLRYELHEDTLAGLLEGLRDGRLDGAVAAITVTKEREEVVDFTNPFHTSGLAIAMRHEHDAMFWALVQALLSRDVVVLVIAIAVMQFIVGSVVWLAEHRKNPGHFGGGARRGIASGYWWATVTMTTVGYGDKFPVTAAGRAIALGWMLISVAMVSVFTASVATNMTLARLEARIESPEDLRKIQVGTVRGTTSESYLRSDHFDFRSFVDADAGVDALMRGEIGAFVYDEPLLRVVVQQRGDVGLHVVPNTFKRQDYAFALPQGSPLRERINRVLLDLRPE